MTQQSSHEVTQLLLAWGNGDQASLEKLIPLVHKELYRLAKHYMAGERPGHPLQTTALVNEAYLRLIDWKNVRWQSRAHFFGVSAKLMRQILVDFARNRPRLASGEARHVALDEASVVPERQDVNLVALDDALKTLATLDPRQSQVVELRFFGGLSLEEIAEVLKVSLGTIKRDWGLARAWLLRELSEGEGDDA